MTDKVERQANILKAEYKEKITKESYKNDVLFNKFEKIRFDHFALLNEHVRTLPFDT